MAFDLKGTADKLACALRCTIGSKQIQYKFAVSKKEGRTKADRHAYQ